MNQDDKQELKGWARSIDSLFTQGGDAEAVEPGTDKEPELEPEGLVDEPDLTFGFDEPEGTPEPGSGAADAALELDADFGFGDSGDLSQPDEEPPEPILQFGGLSELGDEEKPLETGEAAGALGEAVAFKDQAADAEEVAETPDLEAVEAGAEFEEAPAEAEEPEQVELLVEGLAAPPGDEAPVEAVPVEAVPVVQAPPTAEADPDAPEEEPRTPVELALEAAVSQYLRATSEQRPEFADALRAAVKEARAANALAGLARAMNALLVQPVPDPEAETLADEFMNAATQMSMALRLGSVRDERERADLVHAYAKLGDPMAAAIADALTETDDRLARKTYVSALVALGQSGLRVVEEMLDDSRWFVARNGVAVLGEVGGDTAIGHLTGTLAQEDARVRRETVLSLAKIGGEDASLLVVGMLNDSDPDVRATAARAVSVLKVERAHRPLMDILEEGDEDAVIEQVIRALGQLGDPSAVALIEKKAVGSFFSKSPMEIRLAALSALGAIGTPHAMSVVESAEGDKDPKIRALVHQVLSAK